jgi:microcystin-dependent protein
MSTPFVGEIRMFAGNFAPLGWAFCNGQLMAISQSEVLFNLIGTTYGGDGENTFALPDLQGRFPAHQGNGAVIGELLGSEFVTLTLGQMPVHSHAAVCGAGGGNVVSPAAAFWSTDPQGNTAAYNETGGSGMANGTIAIAGSGQAHDNRQPYLGVNFIISLFGIFPSQS